MIYGAFNTKTGLIEVKILDGGDSVSTEIIDIGKLKYEFDLLPDGPEVDAVQALYNKISITIFQFAHTKEDLYDRLLANVVAQKGIKVEVVVDGDVFGFFINLQDVELSETERTISLDCRVLYDGTASVLEVFDEIQAKEPALLKTYRQHLDGTEELDCTGVLDWIKYAMQKLFLNDFDSTIKSVSSGLPAGYTTENYASFEPDPFNETIAYTMIRMTDPPFGGIDPDEEWERLNASVVAFNNTTKVFAVPYPQSKYVNLEQELRPGDNVRFFPGPLSNPEWQERVISQILSPSSFTVTAPPSGWITAQIFEIKKKTSTADLLALEALQELAAIEGSIFGTGFGKNFYFNRIAQQDIVEVDWQDVLDCDVDQFYNPAGIAVRQLAKTVTEVDISTDLFEGQVDSANLGTKNFGVWPAVAPWDLPDRGLPFITDAKAVLKESPGTDKDIFLRIAPGYPFLSSAMWSSVESVFHGSYEYQGIKWYNNVIPTQALCRTGLISYTRSLSTDGTGIIVEFTVVGAKSIKPWNLITFGGDGLPGKYANKRFRPTSLEYDLVMDTVSVKAYEIFESDVLDPSNELFVSGVSSSTGTVSTSSADPIQVSGSSASTGTVSTENSIIALRAPENLTACQDTVQEPEVMRLSWDAATGADSYEVQRSSDGPTTGFTSIATPTATQTDDSLPADNPTTEYWYRVRSIEGTTESDYSDALSVTYNTLISCGA